MANCYQLLPSRPTPKQNLTESEHLREKKKTRIKEPTSFIDFSSFSEAWASNSGCHWAQGQFSLQLRSHLPAFLPQDFLRTFGRSNVGLVDCARLGVTSRHHFWSPFARFPGRSMTSIHVLTLRSFFLREQRASLLGARTLLGAPGITSRNKKLLVASLLLGTKGIATRSKGHRY